MLDSVHMKLFKEMWDELEGERQEKLAKRCNTTRDYLYQVANGYRKPSPKLSRKLEQETGIARVEFRPDVFGELRA